MHFIYRNIDDVDKTMDEINEQTENMKQIQEALATPIGAAADFDEVPDLLLDYASFPISSVDILCWTVHILCKSTLSHKMLLYFC